MRYSLLAVGLLAVHAAFAEIVVPDGLVFDTDVPYGKQSVRQRLDILYPAESRLPLPVIIHIHGGGWYTGGKGGERTFAMMETFAEAGFVAVSIEYRLSDEAHFPAAVEDCKLAVRWLRAHARRYHIDTGQFAAIGASAGGHLSAMLAVTRAEDGLEGDGGYPDESSALQAAVPVAAPFDLRVPLSLKYEGEDDPVVVRFLGGPIAEHQEAAEKGSPINYVRRDVPPQLIVQGTADMRVDRRTQADPMISALARNGAPYETIFVEGGKHGMGIAREQETLKKIVEFLGRHLAVQ
jgi:acetyl esterase/lipase